MRCDAIYRLPIVLRATANVLAVINLSKESTTAIIEDATVWLVIGTTIPTHSRDGIGGPGSEAATRLRAELGRERSRHVSFRETFVFRISFGGLAQNLGMLSATSTSLKKSETTCSGRQHEQPLHHVSRKQFLRFLFLLLLEVLIQKKKLVSINGSFVCCKCNCCCYCCSKTSYREKCVLINSTT